MLLGLSASKSHAPSSSPVLPHLARRGLGPPGVTASRGSRSRDEEEEHNRRFAWTTRLPPGPRARVRTRPVAASSPRARTVGRAPPLSPHPLANATHRLLHAASRSLRPSLPATPPLSPPAVAMGSTGHEPEVTRADFPDGFVFGVATSAYQVSTRSPPSPSHPVGPPSLAVPSRRVLAPCLRLHTARQLVHALACFCGSLLLRFESEW
jgi:hypothetical protein